VWVISTFSGFWVGFGYRFRFRFLPATATTTLPTSPPPPATYSTPHHRIGWFGFLAGSFRVGCIHNSGSAWVVWLDGWHRWIAAWDWISHGSSGLRFGFCRQQQQTSTASNSGFSPPPPPAGSWVLPPALLPACPAASLSPACTHYHHLHFHYIPPLLPPATAHYSHVLGLVWFSNMVCSLLGLRKAGSNAGYLPPTHLPPTTAPLPPAACYYPHYHTTAPHLLLFTTPLPLD